MAGCFAGCWWNKCVLICTETWLRKADTEPNFKLWEGFFFLNSVFFFSFSWQAHFSSLSRMAAGSAIITLYSITEHSIMGLSCLLLSISLTGLCSAKSWKLINSLCLTSQPFVSGVLWCANIVRTPHQDRSSMCTETPKTHDCFQTISVSESSAQPSIHSGWTLESQCS